MNDDNQVAESLINPGLKIKKNINVQEVSNGYVVSMNYGRDTKIATTKEEALKIIDEFISVK